MRRHALSNRKSRKLFKKGRRPDKRNVTLPPMRGGFRL